MANPKVKSYSPANGSMSLPLDQTSGIWVEFVSGVDVTEFSENFFVEGPDTDQYIGPGLIELTNPDNISQGDLDDFLKSPGYKGIVDGSFYPASGVATKIFFNPTHALAPSWDYKAYLIGTYDVEIDNVLTTVSGLSFNFQTGTGSIQQLPSNLSTSVLADVIAHGYVASPGPIPSLKVVRTHPADHSVENNLQIAEIVVEFDKALDPNSLTPESVFIETLPVTDHPSAPQFAQGEIMTQLEVSGCQLKIKLQ